MHKVEQRLQEVGLILPIISVDNSIFAPYIVSGNTVYISGQLPAGFGDLSSHAGRLGENITIEGGKKIAVLSTLNLIAQLKRACDGDLDRVNKCLKLTVFVNSSSNFIDQPIVANAASELIVRAFGQKGTHARSAIGVNQLPFGVAVEVEGIFEINV